ncbi:MAG: flippase-like domain-containing protein [Bacteroidetes bacterium]|nr:flippase-like domain-containing protein [Bacteroidota bacterium]
MKITKKTLTNLVLLVFAAGVFIWIGFKTDWEKTWSSIRSANLSWLGTSLIFMLGAHWCRGARWTLLTEPAGYKLNARRSFYSVMVGYLVNVATSRGGEIVRSAITAKSEKAPVELLIGTVVTERIVDFIMLFFVCLAALALQFKYIYSFFDTYIITPLSEKLSWETMGLLILILAGIAFILFRLRKKNKSGKTQEKKGIWGIIARFSEGLKTVFELKSPSKFIVLSFGIWVGYWLSGWCVMKSLAVTEHFGILTALSLVVFSSIGIAIPLPAGAGVWGAVSFGLQTVYGMSTANADTYGIYTIAISNLIMIIFGAVCYFLLYFEMQKLQKNAA